MTLGAEGTNAPRKVRMCLTIDAGLYSISYNILLSYTAERTSRFALDQSTYLRPVLVRRGAVYNLFDCVLPRVWVFPPHVNWLCIVD
jgi:hypothetical protein